MKRIKLVQGVVVPLIEGSTVQDQFLSIEGGSCRIYTGAAAPEPSELFAGHMVRDGYQVIVPAGVQAWALLQAGESGSAVVSDFGQ